MRVFAQITCLVLSFLAVFFLSILFEMTIGYSIVQYREMLGNKPVPPITQSVISNPHLSGHLFILPWIGMIGALAIRKKRFLDPVPFVIHYLAFLTIEAFLTLVYCVALALPTVTLIGRLYETGRQEIVQLPPSELTALE
jgi:hypothetical protein